MKVIDNETFGNLYKGLQNYLEKTDGNLNGAGIEKGFVNEKLRKSWEEGKIWDTVTQAIAYHYSRTDSLLLKLSSTTFFFRQESSLREIEVVLGITPLEKIKISLNKEEFKREFRKLWGYLKEEKKINSKLIEMGIKNGNPLNELWKQGNKWEVITTILILLKLKTYEIINIETEYGTFKFTRKVDSFQIIETLQNTLFPA